MLHRLLSTNSGDEENEDTLFNVAVAVIFAREVLEGAIIIINYRTVINKNESWDEEKKQQGLKILTWSSIIATIVALVVILALAIPLSLLGNDLPGETIEIIEGVSKVVACICIIQLSVKIPVWLGLYWRVSIFPWKQKDMKKPEGTDVSFNEIKFNVAWNIWREVAECGVFLIPFFLDDKPLKAIPLSALLGIVISLVIGMSIYVANHKLQNKVWLAIFMSSITLFLAVGLFTSGCHLFEEVWGETAVVWKIKNDAWSHKKFPMVIAKPFGYSSTRTVLQIACFWSSLLTGLGYHYLKYRATIIAKERFGDEPDVAKDPENGETTQDVEKSDEDEVVSA
jgi:high-affinity iron transporter